MEEEHAVDKLRKEALQIQLTEPRKALELLMDAAKIYPGAWAVANLILDDIIGIGRANGFWDDPSIFVIPPPANWSVVPLLCVPIFPEPGKSPVAGLRFS